MDADDKFKNFISSENESTLLTIPFNSCVNEGRPQRKFIEQISSRDVVCIGIYEDLTVIRTWKHIEYPYHGKK